MRYQLSSGLASDGEGATFTLSKSVTPELALGQEQAQAVQGLDSNVSEIVQTPEAPPSGLAETAVPVADAEALFAAIVQDESVGELVELPATGELPNELAALEQLAAAPALELPEAEPLIEKAPGDVADGDGDDNLLEGGDGASTLSGRGGRDTLDGGLGDDELDGGRGRDDLNGGDGDDYLDGGRGRDTMSGGEGSDTFAFTERSGDDTITDFDASSFAAAVEGAELVHDVLDFSAIEGIASMDDLEIEQDGDDTVIYFGDNALTLENVDAENLTEQHFKFEAADELPEVLMPG